MKHVHDPQCTGCPACPGDKGFTYLAMLCESAQQRVARIANENETRRAKHRAATLPDFTPPDPYAAGTARTTEYRAAAGFAPPDPYAAGTASSDYRAAAGFAAPDPYAAGIERMRRSVQ